MKRAAFILVVLLLGACSRSSNISFVRAGDLPRDLYGGLQRPVVPQRNVQFALYFVREDAEGRPTGLAVITRQKQTNLRTAELVMRELLNRPTAQEIRRGFLTAIPFGTQLLSVSVVDGVASVNLSAQFESADPEVYHLLRVAQVVYTLTELPDVDSVRFRIHGVPQPVVDQFGVAHDRVGPARYSRYAPIDTQTSAFERGSR